MLEGKNPVVITTIAAIFAVVGYAIANYALGKAVDTTNAVIFVVVFWIVFFVFQRFIAKKAVKTA